MTSGQSTQVSIEDQTPQQLAQTLTDYAYPLVIMKISRDLMLNSALRPRTPDNHLILFKQLAQPENTQLFSATETRCTRLRGSTSARAPSHSRFPIWVIAIL